MRLQSCTLVFRCPPIDKLNSGKTVSCTCLGTRHQLAKVDISVVNVIQLVHRFSCFVLSFTSASSSTKNCHLPTMSVALLADVSTVRRTHTVDTTVALVNAVVISRIDYTATQPCPACMMFSSDGYREFSEHQRG